MSLRKFIIAALIVALVGYALGSLTVYIIERAREPERIVWIHA